MESNVSPLLPTDVLIQVLLRLSFLALCVLARCGGDAPVLVEQEKRGRIYDGLEVYVHRKRLDEFFTSLTECRGAIFGPLVIEILNGRSRSNTIIGVLEVVVALGVENSIAAMLTAEGYQSQTVDIPRVYQDTVSTITEFTRTLNGQTIQVRVYNSSGESLSVVLSSPSTIHMNVITANTIIMFYPRQSLRDESVVVHGQDLQEMQALVGPHIQQSSTNSGWRKACGIYCPVIMRKSYADWGIAQYRWGQGIQSLGQPVLFGSSRKPAKKDWVDPLLGEYVEWQISKACSNPHCPIAGKQAAMGQCLYL